jgi:polar amino acid transport system permease protein
MNFWQITLELLGGFGLTCLLFFLTLLFAIPLGLLLSFGSMSKVGGVKKATRIFIWIIRGIPLMLLICMIYYLPGLLGKPGTLNVFDAMDRYFTALSGSSTLLYYGSFCAVLIAFVINYSCYFSEIFRGGIESVSQGQYEAGYVLGMSKTQIFFKVILKQVVKRIVPALSNEIITLVKDTALARVIAVVEILKLAEQLASRAMLWPLFYTGAFYLLFVGALTLLFNHFEKKLSYFKA